MKKLFYYLFLAAVSISFYSCSSSNEEPDPSPGPDNEEPSDSVSTVDLSSFFILNGGSSYNAIDGTLSYYTYATEDYKHLKESLTIFKDSNERSLGITPNDMALYGDSLLYVVVYESATIEVIDIKTMKAVNHIKFEDGNGDGNPSQPRHIAIDGNLAYITTYDGFLVMYNCDTQQRGGYVYLGNEGANPEGVVVVGTDIYVALSGGLNYTQALPYDNKVCRINKASLDIIETFEVGLNPTSLVTNGTDVFVLCMGDYIQDMPQIYRISGNIATAYVPGTMMAIRDRQLYVINAPYDSENDPTYTCYWIDNSADSYDFLDKGEGVDYPTTLAIDQATGNIIIGSATMDGQYPSYTEDGYFKMYSSDGKKLLEGNTGVDPCAVTFVPKPVQPAV